MYTSMLPPPQFCDKAQFSPFSLTFKNLTHSSLSSPFFAPPLKIPSSPVSRSPYQAGSLSLPVPANHLVPVPSKRIAALQEIETRVKFSWPSSAFVPLSIYGIVPRILQDSGKHRSLVIFPPLGGVLHQSTESPPKNLSFLPICVVFASPTPFLSLCQLHPVFSSSDFAFLSVPFPFFF